MDLKVAGTKNGITAVVNGYKNNWNTEEINIMV